MFRLCLAYVAHQISYYVLSVGRVYLDQWFSTYGKLFLKRVRATRVVTKWVTVQKRLRT